MYSSMTIPNRDCSSGYNLNEFKARKAMRILVAIKQVLDGEVDVSISADAKCVLKKAMPQAINPFDEVALETAIASKEQGIASEITVASIGNDSCKQSLSLALAMGADTAILCQTEREVVGGLYVAKALAKLAKQQRVDLVIMGKQAIDSDANQTGQMTAALLNWGQAINVSKLSVNREKTAVLATCDTDNGGLQVKLPLPGVVTTALRLNTPRIPTVADIVRARSKPIEVLDVADCLGDAVQPTVKITKVRKLSNQKNVTMLKDAADLAAVIDRVSGAITEGG